MITNVLNMGFVTRQQHHNKKNHKLFFCNFPFNCLLFSPTCLIDAKHSGKVVCQPHGTIWTNKVPQTDTELK